ncbi:hypothetical protein MRX96_000614 [Rhipicephalus microplus]
MTGSLRPGELCPAKRRRPRTPEKEGARGARASTPKLQRESGFLVVRHAEGPETQIPTRGCSSTLGPF